MLFEKKYEVADECLPNPRFCYTENILGPISREVGERGRHIFKYRIRVCFMEPGEVSLIFLWLL